MDVAKRYVEGILFNSPFDAAQANGMIPGVFTFSHEGEIGLDVPRTRDFFKYHFERITATEFHSWNLRWNHCVLIDIATDWPRYALITADELCIAHPRCQIERYEQLTTAQERVAELKNALYMRSSPEAAYSNL